MLWCDLDFTFDLVTLPLKPCPGYISQTEELAVATYYDLTFYPNCTVSFDNYTSIKKFNSFILIDAIIVLLNHLVLILCLYIDICLLTCSFLLHHYRIYTVYS